MPDPTPANPKGLFCPNCRGVRLAVTTTKRPCPGRRVRYRKCTACGTRIRTVEVITHVHTDS